VIKCIWYYYTTAMLGMAIRIFKNQALAIIMLLGSWFLNIDTVSGQ